MEPSPNESESPSESPESPPASGPAPAPGPTVNDLERWIGTRLGWYGDQLDSQRWAALWKTLQTNQWQLDNEAREAAITWGPHCRLSDPGITSTADSPAPASSQPFQAGPLLRKHWEQGRVNEIETFARYMFQFPVEKRQQKWAWLQARVGQIPSCQSRLKELEPLVSLDVSGIQPLEPRSGRLAQWLREIAVHPVDQRFEKIEAIWQEISAQPRTWTECLIQLWKAHPEIVELCPAFQYDWICWARRQRDPDPIVLPRLYQSQITSRVLQSAKRKQSAGMRGMVTPGRNSNMRWSNPAFRTSVFVWVGILALLGIVGVMKLATDPGFWMSNSDRRATPSRTPSGPDFKYQLMAKKYIPRILWEFLDNGLDRADWSLESLQSIQKRLLEMRNKVRHFPGYADSGIENDLAKLGQRIQREEELVRREMDRPPAPLLPDQSPRYKRNLSFIEQRMLSDDWVYYR